MQTKFLIFSGSRNVFADFLISFLISICITGCAAPGDKHEELDVQKVIAKNTPSTNWTEYNGDGAKQSFD